MSSRIDGAGDGSIPPPEPKPRVEPATPASNIPEKFPPKEGQAHYGDTPGVVVEKIEGSGEKRRRFIIPKEPLMYDKTGKIVTGTVDVAEEEFEKLKLERRLQESWEDGKNFEEGTE